MELVSARTYIILYVAVVSDGRLPFTEKFRSNTKCKNPFHNFLKAFKYLVS